MLGVNVSINLRACLPPGVLAGVSFVLPAAMVGYSASFFSGGVDRLSVPATGDACTGVHCS